MQAFSRPAAPAQQATTQATTRKFDEFGDIQYSDKIARLDNFAIQLQSEPDKRGFIIVYRTRRDLQGLSSRYALWMKSYLVRTSGIAPSRIRLIDGGYRSLPPVELWVAPPVASAPVPNPQSISTKAAKT